MGDIFEAILKVFLEIFFELAVKGPGYLLVKWFFPKSESDPDGCLVLICGMASWLLIGLGIWLFFLLL